METFINETEDAKKYLIEEILDDGACFYRAFGNSLLYLSKIKDIRDLMKTPLDQLFNTPWDVLKENKLEEYYLKRSFGKGLKEQTFLAKYIQLIAKNWIVNHYQDKMETGETIGECLKMTHSILDQPELKDMEEVIKYYDIWYDYFSGDVIQYQEDGQDRILCERWASTIEQYALSKLFQIPILIYVDQRYDEKKNKIVRGIINLPKGQSVGSTRLRLISIIGQEYLSDDKPQLKLLYRVDNKKGLHHYMVLYSKE